tara:strand:+ start:126 stop:332 length:207 start_codon:yes stop_codon:yes gene_type:complete
MAAGVDPDGPMDEGSPHSITRIKEATSKAGVSTRWIVLVVTMTALVLDLVGVLEVPIGDLLGWLLVVL